MPKIAIKDINIKGKERVRKDYGDIDELADSIARHGLIQPIVLDDNNVLLAGGRRLAAHIQLGLEDIEFTRKENISDEQRKEIELEENIRRKDLAWPEEVTAILALYELRQELYGANPKGGRPGLGDGPSTGAGSLASEIERSKGSVVLDLQLARALREFPDLADEATKSSAIKRYKRLKETEIRTEQARRTRVEHIDDDATPGFRVDTQKIPDDQLSPEEQDQLANKPAAPRPTMPIKIAWKGRGILYQGDSTSILSLLPHNSIDCIVTDPPFALGMFKEGQANSGARLAESAGHMYDDDPARVMDMLDQVLMHAAKLLKPDGHAYIFFHMTKYEEMFLMIRRHFGVCEETPLIWAKNTPGIGDPNRAWVYSYEPCFWVNRGRALVKPQAFNVLRHDTVPPGKKIHPTEKPAALLRDIISASCVQGEVVLDPFAGSGSTLVGASQVGCKFIGVEREAQFHRAAVERISEVLAADLPADQKDKNALEALHEATDKQ